MFNNFSHTGRVILRTLLLYIVCFVTDLCKSMIRSNSYDSSNPSDDDDNTAACRRSTFSDDEEVKMLKCSQLCVGKDQSIKLNIPVIIRLVPSVIKISCDLNLLYLSS